MNKYPSNQTVLLNNEQDTFLIHNNNMKITIYVGKEEFSDPNPNLPTINVLHSDLRICGLNFTVAEPEQKDESYVLLLKMIKNICKKYW